MPYLSRFLTLSSFLALSALALVVACSANGGGVSIPETDEGEAGATAPAPTSALPPSSTPDAEASIDAGKDAGKDAAKDAAKDSAFDAGKPAPNTGDACKTFDEIFPRTCGICGTQLAICLASTDGTPGVVSDYSPCGNELAGGCAPGTMENEACGNCGTRVRTCTKYCAWSAGGCAGQPVDSCTPTSQDYTTAGCPTSATVRTRSCSAVCSWSNFTGTCDPLAFKLVVAATPGDTVSGIYPLRATVVAKRIGGTCPNPSLSTTTNHPYVYVELINPTENALTLSAWNTAAPNGGPIIDTVMTWYEGNTKPGDDATRKACKKSVGDACPSGLPCGDSRWAGLTGTNAITLPPFGSALLFFGSYYAAGGASAAEGNVKLVARTEPGP
jgi:hypothetical protein